MKKSLIILTVLSLIAVVSSCGTNTNTSDTTTATQTQYSTPAPTESTKIEKNVDAVAEFLGLKTVQKHYIA